MCRCSAVMASACGSLRPASAPAMRCWRTVSNSLSGNVGSRRISTARRIAAGRFASMVSIVALALVALPETLRCAFSLSISSWICWRVWFFDPRINMPPVLPAMVALPLPLAEVHGDRLRIGHLQIDLLQQPRLHAIPFFLAGRLLHDIVDRLEHGLCRVLQILLTLQPHRSDHETGVVEFLDAHARS